MGLLGSMMVIVWKDVLLELRSKDLVISVVVFGLLVVVVFNFALNNTPGRSEELAPGILWAAFAFAAVLAMNRAFVRDQEQGGLEGLLISPVSRDAIFLGKALTSLIFMLLVEAALLPVYAVMLDFSALSWYLMLTIFLGTLGFAVVGTLFSAIAVQTRSREIMLPLLFLPTSVPLIMAAVESTSVVVNGGSWADFSAWLQLAIAFDVIFVISSAVLFQFVLEE